MSSSGSSGGSSSSGTSGITAFAYQKGHLDGKAFGVSGLGPRSLGVDVVRDLLAAQTGYPDSDQWSLVVPAYRSSSMESGNNGVVSEAVLPQQQQPMPQTLQQVHADQQALIAPLKALTHGTFLNIPTSP